MCKKQQQPFKLKDLKLSGDAKNKQRFNIKERLANCMASKKDPKAVRDNCPCSSKDRKTCPSTSKCSSKKEL